MARVTLKNINKTYDGNVKAVFNFNLDIKDKEFVVFVGPSGCGKSTILRMIAGLEEITEGEILIDDRRINNVEPKNRDIAMVFQNYALYPHMNVYDNMAFSLKQRKTDKKEIDRKVREAAKILDIEDYLGRKPKALSGGQRQRVALGRAIVREPKVFLMDEPLSNLDASLRTQMRTEILKLHERLETTFIYVTHDQIEAMTMGDRIVIMNEGVIQQADSPLITFDRPANMFVAGFIGSLKMNFIEGTVKGGKLCFSSKAVEISNLPRKIKGVEEGQKVLVGIRPEHMNISRNTDAIPVVIEFIEHVGAEMYLHFTLQQAPFTVRANTDGSIKKGDTCYIEIPESKIHLFNKNTGSSLFAQ